MAAHPFRILSLDGGGIRGIMTAIWLQRLEDLLGARTRDHFDLIAGTSTGSILACGVALGIPARDIVEMYRQRGREVFPSAAARRWNRMTRVVSQGISAPKYDPSGLEGVLRDVFKDATLRDLRTPTIVTSYNTLGRTSVVFKSFDARYWNLRVRDVCQASSSAPTYFPARVLRLGDADVPLIDGGVVANNPTMWAIAEAVRFNARPGDPGLADFVVASFGTGELTRPIDIPDALEWGAIEWAVPIIDVLFDGAADATDYCTRQLCQDGSYFRFQTKLHEAYDDMDNADATNINALVMTAGTYIESEGALLRRLVDKLTSRPDARPTALVG